MWQDLNSDWSMREQLSVVGGALLFTLYLKISGNTLLTDCTYTHWLLIT